LSHSVEAATLLTVRISVSHNENGRSYLSVIDLFSFQDVKYGVTAFVENVPLMNIVENA